MEMCAGTQPTEPDLSSSFSLVDNICEPVKIKCYTVHMDQWFTNSILFDHLRALSTKAVGTVMANRK
jgi:hypothetical protein